MIFVLLLHTKQPLAYFHLILFGVGDIPRDDCQWDMPYEDIQSNDSFNDFIELIIETIDDCGEQSQFKHKWRNCLKNNNRKELIIKIGKKASRKKQINWKCLMEKHHRVQLHDNVWTQYNGKKDDQCVYIINCIQRNVVMVTIETIIINVITTLKMRNRHQVHHPNDAKRVAKLKLRLNQDVDQNHTLYNVKFCLLSVDHITKINAMIELH